MPLQRIDITIDDDGGRDARKVFHIVEMGAEPFAEWLVRVASAAKAADPNADFDTTAIQGTLISVIGSLLKGDPQVTIGLLRELMTCVKTGPAPGKLRLPGDIEEFLTVFHLQRKVFELHTGFSLPGSTLR
jgi:hypothetical protein